MNDDTLEVPLPPGTKPNPDGISTQELPLVCDTSQLVTIEDTAITRLPGESIRLEIVPPHLLGEPILTMDAPVADETPLYDQLNPREPKAPPRERRRMPMGDRFLIGMGVAAAGAGVVVYGMVVYGWGDSSHFPEAAPSPVVSTTTSAPRPDIEPTVKATERPKAAETVQAAQADPTHYAPEPTRSITVVEAPSASETPVETTVAPEPSPTPTRPSTPPPSPTTTAPSPTPTPTPTESQSASPSVSITLPASPTEEQP